MHMTARASDKEVQRRSNDGEKKTCQLFMMNQSIRMWNEHVTECFRVVVSKDSIAGYKTQVLHKDLNTERTRS